MNPQELEKLKYPIGKMPLETSFSKERIAELIDAIEKQPEELMKVVNTISKEEEKYSYRPGGWTVRQIVHHIADSHLNAYVRTKLALTENNPVIKPYNENEWVLLEDTKQADLSVSVELLRLITYRWVLILRSLSDEQLSRTFHHPEKNKDISLKTMLSMYNWHGYHHIAHIGQAIALRIK